MRSFIFVLLLICSCCTCFKQAIEYSSQEINDILGKTVLTMTDVPSMFNVDPTRSISFTIFDKVVADRPKLFIYIGRSRVIISQLGTSFKSKDDFLVNLQSSTAQISFGSRAAFSVHKGFLANADHFLPKIRAHLDEARSQLGIQTWKKHEFIFAGHSQGAAVNLLIASRLAEKLQLQTDRHQIKVLAFGSPRVFGQYPHGFPIPESDILRFEAVGDWVCTKPGNFVDYGNAIGSIQVDSQTLKRKIASLFQVVSIATYGLGALYKNYQSHRLDYYLMGSGKSLENWQKH